MGTLHNFFIALTLGGVLGASTLGFAKSVSSDTELGANSTSETISGDGDIGETSKSKKPVDQYSWNAEATVTKTSSIDSTTQQTVTDRSTQVSGGIDWDGKSGWKLGAGLTYGQSPDEDLEQSGPTFSIGYTKHFAPPATPIKPPQKNVAKAAASEDVDDENDDDDLDAPSEPASSFSASLGAELTLGVVDYKQTFFATKTNRLGRARPVKGTNGITQSSAEFAFSARPWKWLKAKISATTYKYNRNVQDFVQYLDSSRVSSLIGSSGFASTVSGLPSSDASLSLYFYILETWEVDVSQSVSTAATDQSQSTSSKLQILKELLDDWTIGLGARVQASNSGNDQSALVHVSYDF